MLTNLAHQYAKLTDEKKAIAADATMNKEALSKIEGLLVEALATTGLRGVVIGDSQITIDEKYVASVHCKKDAIEVLKKGDFNGFVKEDLVTAALNALITEIMKEYDEAVAECEETGEDPEKILPEIPEELTGIVSPFKVIKLKVKKAA